MQKVRIHRLLTQELIPKDIEHQHMVLALMLKDGDKVKVSIRFRGRERGHTATGEQVMKQFAEVVADVGQIEKKPLLEGRSMTMILAPKPKKQ